MGPIPTAGLGAGPPSGGLARVLARAAQPPVAVPSAYAGESRPVVRPAAGVAPVERVAARLSALPPVVADLPPVVGPPGPASPSPVNELTQSQVLQPTSPRRSVNEVTPSQVLSSPGQPQLGREPTPGQPRTGEGTRAAALVSSGPPETGVTSRRAESPDDLGRVETAAPMIVPVETDPDLEPDALLDSPPVSDLPVSPLIQEAVIVPRGRVPDARAAPPPDIAPVPEPVTPVVIGRIEVHVDSPAAQPDPFAGCRVVAAGLTARRGGGW